MKVFDMISRRKRRMYSLWIFLFLFCGLSISAQVQTLNLFQVDHQQELQWKALRSNRNVRILNYDPAQYLKIKQEKLTRFNLILPGLEGNDIELELTENKVLSEDFVLSTDKARNLAYTPGLYYSGRIKGQSQSLVVLSLFENEVMGMITPPGRSNLIIGNSPVLRRNSFILFDDGQVDVPQFTCLSTELPNWTKDLNLNEGGLRHSQNAAKCVKVYFECGLSVHENKGGVSGAANFVSSFYNAVSAMYSREGLSTAISEIKVWTTLEPYGGTADRGLQDFGSALSGNFNGDLAHFIRLKSGTFNGLAWLDVLCKSNRYAYSEVSTNYSAYPTYSWTVNVITHEMGHNLGSPHTQSCTWPGGAIDNCANPEGTCSAGPRPTDGGTIMSYCHQLTSIGINFSNGFGTLPGNRIRDRFDNASCLTSCDGGGGEIISSPDLIISSLQSSLNELSSTSQTSQITINTTNSGNSIAAASKTAAFLSTDELFSTNDISLTSINVAALSGGASISNNFNFNFPNVNPGNYYLIVCADQGNAVQETSEANNCRTLAMKLNAPTNPNPTNPNPTNPPPNPVLQSDLTLSVSSVVPTITAPGASFVIQGTVLNLGPGSTSISTVGMVLSADANYSANDISLTTVTIPTLDIQVTKTFSSTVSMPAGLPMEDYKLLVCADAANQISEVDEGNNCKSFSIKIHSDKPDLITQNLTINPNPSPSGNPLTLSYADFNQGALNANPFWTGVYLSRNNKTKDADDILLGQTNNAAGLGSNQTKPDQFSVSSVILPGTYNILVCSDDRNQVTESDESNNCSSISVTITSPLPDLIVEQFSLPNEFYLGDSVAVKCVIANQGFLKSNPSKAKLYLATTPSTGGNPLQIALIDVPALEVDAKFEPKIKIKISELKWLGRPYFTLCADADLGIKESIETNNCREFQSLIKDPSPDLKMILKSFSSDSIPKGSTVRVPISVTNIGKKSAPQNETEIYLSDKSLVKTNGSLTLAIDTLSVINPGDTLNSILDLAIPGSLSAGTYYLNICSDYNQKIKEESETNNCQSYRFHIRNPRSDISVVNFELLDEILYSDLPASLQLRILNSGERLLKNIEVNLIVATETDTLTSMDWILDSLASAQNWDSTFNIQLPNEFSNQAIHFIVKADPSNKINEVIENNNSATLTRQLNEALPDLIAVNLHNLDTNFYSGDSNRIETVITNLGLIHSPEFLVTVWLIDPVKNEKHPDTLLSFSYYHSGLEVGQSDSIKTALIIPQSLVSGDYTLAVSIDPLNKINESSKNNNIISTPVHHIQRLPDISVADFTLPETIVRNQTMNASVQIVNQGDWDMPALVDTIYWSTDSIYSVNDKPIGWVSIPSLAVAESKSIEINWSLNDQVTSGKQFLLFTLDATNKISEKLKSNNSVIQSIQVPSKKADLSLMGLQLLNSTIFPGDTLIITNFIENIGESDANAFELNQFIKKHPSDTQVFFRFPSYRINGLAAGQSKDLTTTVILPDSIITSAYYLISCLDNPHEVDELREDNNCGQIIVTVHAKQGISTGINHTPLFYQLKAYPNPVSHSLNLSGTLIQAQQNMNLSIRDYTGRILYHKKLSSGIDFKTSVELSHLPGGMYYFDLSSSQGSWKQTFIKL